MNGLAGYYVSTIGKPHEYFDLTRSKPCNQGWIDFLRSTGARHGRGTAAEGETGLDFAGEKSAC